jgi:RNA polymerase sigma-70 factor (ECF subfamily)
LHVTLLALSETAMADAGADETNRQMIARIAAGDRDALTECYRHWQHPLFVYLLHRCGGDRSIAEEILQDTFLAVWQSAGRFEGRSHVRTWLIGIARRQAHNTLRRRQLPGTGLDDVTHWPEAGPAPEESAIASAMRDELIAKLEQLPAANRETLELVLVHGLSYAEVAEVLHVPLGTVKSRLNGAKRALRTLLANARKDRP